MTYHESQQRDEAYRAGREGRSVITPYGDDYDRGKKERRNAQRRRDDPGGGGGPGLVILLMLFFVVVAVAVVLVAAIGAAAGAVAAALPLWFVARLPPGGENIGYRLAYRSSFVALLAWILLTLVVGVGAEYIRTEQPGAWHEWVRTTGDAFLLGVGSVLAKAAAWAPTPDSGIFAEASGTSAFSRFGRVGADAAGELGAALSAPGVFAVLVLLPLLGAAVAIRAMLPFGGFAGFVRACIATPIVVALGSALMFVALVGVRWVGLRADLPPALPGAELGVAAAVTSAAVGGAALVGALLGGPLVAAITTALTFGRRFPLRNSISAMGLAAFVAALVGALALYLFRDADAYVANVAAAVAARGVIWPSASVLAAFMVVAAPGVLLGALILRAGLRDSYRGVVGYLAACAVFAPIALALDTAALAAGVLALESPEFLAWLR